MNSRIRNLEEYHAAYQESVENPEKFWANIAEEFSWRKPWSKVLSWNFDVFDVKCSCRLVGYAVDGLPPDVYHHAHVSARPARFDPEPFYRHRRLPGLS